MYSSSSNSVSQNVGKGSSTIILTQDNVENTNGLNNTLVYNFPSSINLSNSQIGVVSAGMYYCWSNVNAANGNNKFSYNWLSTFPSSTLVRNVLTVSSFANSTVQINELLASSNLLNTLSVVSQPSSTSFVVSQTLSSRSFTDVAAIVNGSGTGSVWSYSSSTCVIQVNSATTPFLVGMTL